MNAPLDETKEWLYFAGEDIRSAHLLNKEGIFSQACYHAQQCAEKSLKAYVVWKGGQVKRTHDLNVLMNECRSLGGNELSVSEEGLDYLNKFYVPMRYPDAFLGSLPEGLPTDEDAHEVIETAEQIYDVVQRIVR